MTTVDRGLYSFNPQSKKLTSFKSKVDSKRTTQVATVRGKVVVATEGDDLFIIDQQGNVSKSSLTINSKGIIVNNIRPWGDDAVLLATASGLFTFDLESQKLRKEFVSAEFQESRTNVTDALFTENKEWVVATKSEGLFLVEEGSTKQYTEDFFQKNALLINELNLLLPDNSGNIWLSSQRGLSVFNIEDSGILGFGPSGNDKKGIPTPNVWSFAESKSGNFIYIGTDRSVSRWDRKNRRLQPILSNQRTLIHWNW